MIRKIEALHELGHWLVSNDTKLNEIKAKAEYENQWFTQVEINRAIEAIQSEYLIPEVLHAWVTTYALQDKNSQHTVGLILAGNIPLVGWHDIQSIYLSGHKAFIKTSGKDERLISALVSKLHEIDGNASSQIKIVDKLEGMDAVIATGSNNTSRYFQAYFGKYPNIIRKNRTSVAFLTGDESDTDLVGLGRDIFSYYGLGCRNVSKLFIPKNYTLNHVIEILDNNYEYVTQHNKYMNNYEYNCAIWTLNKENFLMGNSLLYKYDYGWNTRIASVHIETYDTLSTLQSRIVSNLENLQCVVGKQDVLNNVEVVPFGESQTPKWNEFADNKDTMKFLKEEV
jgi:hypothetical protein